MKLNKRRGNFSLVSLYVVVTVDKDDGEQITGVFKTFDVAKVCCVKLTEHRELVDLWIEEHEAIVWSPTIF